MVFNQRDKGIFLISSFEGAWDTVQQYSWWEKQNSFFAQVVFFTLAIMKISYLINFILFFIKSFTSGKYVKYYEFVFPKSYR